MKLRIFAPILAVLLLATSVFAQSDGPATPKQDVPPVSAAVVPGLELPADQNVSYDEGFVNIQAKCKGDVKWLVVAAVKVKYITVPQTNSIIISVPPQGGVISVFGVGLVDGKMTEFARTNINVSGGTPTPGPGPNPNPSPTPNPIPSGKLHVTILIDMNNPTPALAKLVNSESLRKGINQRGHWFRLYDIKSPIVAQKKLDNVVQTVGGNAVMIVQTNDGRIIDARALPSSESEILSLISQMKE